MTGSYFIILGLERQGVKGPVCRQSLLGCLANFIKNSESEPLPTRGIVGWGGAVTSLRVAERLGISLRRVMQFEIAVCAFAYCIFGKKKPNMIFQRHLVCATQILPEYGGQTFSSAGLILSADHVTQSSPRVLCTRPGLSSLVFLSSSPSPPWCRCTKTLLSGNIGLSSKSKHFQERTWKSIFSVSTPLCPLLCRWVRLFVKLPPRLLV